MIKKPHSSKGVISVTLAFIGALLLTTSTSANAGVFTIDTGCDELPSYTGSLELEAGDYDVYARLAKRGDVATIKGYVQLPGQYGDCSLLGGKAALASGDKWTKIGDFSAFRLQDYILQLSSESLEGLPNANRPSIMLVPKQNSVCVPDERCEVSVNGEIGYVVPPGTLLNKNSLHAMTLVDPALDHINKVYYYADNQLMYSTNGLESFDGRYIAYGGQSLSRIIDYSSGQQVVIESKSSEAHTDSFYNFLFRLTQKYPKAFQLIIWALGSMTILSVLTTIIRLLRRRHDDRVHHGFIAERKLTAVENLYYVLYDKKITVYIRYSMIAIMSFVMVVVLIGTVTAYIVQLVGVDGASMEKTYYTGDKVIVDKIPKTFALLNGREYVPKRGEVVIVRASFGNAIASSRDTAGLTLIKRVIGLPGERVVVRDGVLRVYNDEYLDGFVPDEGSLWQADMTADKPNENVDIQLGMGEIFVTGDNRPESIDSRFSGPIATNEVIGKVVIRVWPLQR